jgi:hypothetical protein
MNPDPGSGSGSAFSFQVGSGSGSAKNGCGSETLPLIASEFFLPKPEGLRLFYTSEVEILQPAVFLIFFFSKINMASTLSENEFSASPHMLPLGFGRPFNFLFLPSPITPLFFRSLYLDCFHQSHGGVGGGGVIVFDIYLYFWAVSRFFWYLKKVRFLQAFFSRSIFYVNFIEYKVNYRVCHPQRNK